MHLLQRQGAKLVRQRAEHKENFASETIRLGSIELEVANQFIIGKRKRTRNKEKETRRTEIYVFRFGKYREKLELRTSTRI